MLVYQGDNLRQYGLRPQLPQRRPCWEFLAVLSGWLAPDIPAEGNQAPLQTHSLWVFPVGHLHGWRSQGDQSAEIMVRHFTHVPQLLEDHLPACGYYHMELDPDALAHVDRLRQLSLGMMESPTEFFDLQSQHLLSALSCLVLSQTKAKVLTSGDHARHKTKQAIQWYVQHLERHPSLEEVADAVFLSLSHLRRLFYEAHQKSPHKVLSALRMEEVAKRLCRFAESGEKGQGECAGQSLDHIAYDLSFSSASSLSRAFKQHFGCSPRAYRTKFLRGLKRKRRVGPIP